MPFRYLRSLRAWGAAILFCSSVAMAQQPAAEPKPASPDAGTIPSTFRSYIVFDKRTDAKDPLNRTNKIHCLICENNLNPVVAIFARSQPKGADEPLAKLVVELRKLVAADRSKAQNLAAFVIFATLDKEFQADDKRDLFAGEIKSWGEAIGAGGVVLGLTGQTSEAVKTWGLNKDDDITVVVYHRMKMVHKPWTFAKDKMTEADVKAILAATEAELGKK